MLRLIEMARLGAIRREAVVYAVPAAENLKESNFKTNLLDLVAEQQEQIWY